MRDLVQQCARPCVSLCRPSLLSWSVDGFSVVKQQVNHDGIGIDRRRAWIEFVSVREFSSVKKQFEAAEVMTWTADMFFGPKGISNLIDLINCGAREC